MLIVFGGLPGVGKTTLARALASRLGALYVRIDTIEQALGGASPAATAGYDVGVAIAGENLRLGGVVVADAVNPLEIARQSWRNAAASCGSAILEIEVVCSNAAEHRRRIEARAADIAGHVLPHWQDVLDRHYEVWTSPHLAIDTAAAGPEQSLTVIVAALPRPESSPRKLVRTGARC